MRFPCSEFTRTMTSALPSALSRTSDTSALLCSSLFCAKQRAAFAGAAENGDSVPTRKAAALCDADALHALRPLSCHHHRRGVTGVGGERR
jgi:hypothetical protein